MIKNESGRDLAIEMAGGKSHSANGKEKIKVEKPRVYEIWIEDRNHQRITNQYEYTNKKEWNEESNEAQEYIIKVDGELVHSSLFIVDSKNKKYVKIGEVELERGKHNINIKNQNAKIKMTKQNLKFILVSKEEREKAEKLIWKRMNQPKTGVAYIFGEEKGEFYLP